MKVIGSYREFEMKNGYPTQVIIVFLTDVMTCRCHRIFLNESESVGTFSDGCVFGNILRNDHDNSKDQNSKMHMSEFDFLLFTYKAIRGLSRHGSNPHTVVSTIFQYGKPLNEKLSA